MEIIKRKIVAHYNDLQVYEGATAYYLERRSTGEEFTIGDGVGMFLDIEDNFIFAGTEEFNKAVQEWLEESYDELFEAYPFIRNIAEIQELVVKRFEAFVATSQAEVNMDTPIFSFTVRDLAMLIGEMVNNDDFDEDLGDVDTVARAVYCANESGAWGEDFEDQIRIDIDEEFRGSTDEEDSEEETNG